MKFFRVILTGLFYGTTLFSSPVTVIVVGTGVTGLWSAYFISKELEEEGKEDVTLIV